MSVSSGTEYPRLIPHPTVPKLYYLVVGFLATGDNSGGVIACTNAGFQAYVSPGDRVWFLDSASLVGDTTAQNFLVGVNTAHWSLLKNVGAEFIQALAGGAMLADGANMNYNSRHQTINDPVELGELTSQTFYIYHNWLANVNTKLYKANTRFLVLKPR